MKLVELGRDGKGVAELEGSRHPVDLSLVCDACLGDYVIIHAGYAIERLDPAEADATLALFDELARGEISGFRPPAADAQGGSHEVH